MSRTAALLALLILAGCTQDLPPSHVVAPAASNPARSKEPVVAIAPAPHLDPALVALGRQLFFEPRLSKSGQLSCASCHDLERAGTDSRQHMIVGAVGFDTPTVFNASLNARLFWDGRAKTLEDQVDGPLLNPNEMGTTWPALLQLLRDDPEYGRSFRAAFQEPATILNVKAAIAAFERTLVTTGAPFDRYLGGDSQAISADAREGYSLFKEYGCASCHQGANVGGSMFERLGITSDYFQGRRGSERDRGRGAITAIAEDEHVFRVPSLRLSTRTAPYLHDGSIPTLDAAIELMGTYQVGVDIPPGERKQIAEFLSSLVGSYQGRSL